MELARDPINTIGKHLSTKYALNREDITFLRLRMLCVIRFMNAHGQVGLDGLTISLSEFDPIEQTRICSVEPYDLPVLEILHMDNEPIQDGHEIHEECEDVEMSSFTSNAMVAIPTSST